MKKISFVLLLAQFNCLVSYMTWSLCTLFIFDLAKTSPPQSNTSYTRWLNMSMASDSTNNIYHRPHSNMTCWQQANWSRNNGRTLVRFRQKTLWFGLKYLFYSNLSYVTYVKQPSWRKFWWALVSHRTWTAISRMKVLWWFNPTLQPILLPGLEMMTFLFAIATTLIITAVNIDPSGFFN